MIHAPQYITKVNIIPSHWVGEILDRLISEETSLNRKMIYIIPKKPRPIPAKFKNLFKEGDISEFLDIGFYRGQPG
jgi:hypothetical protein